MAAIRRPRPVALLLVILLHAGLAWLLLTARGSGALTTAGRELMTFEVRPEPPKPPPPLPHAPKPKSRPKDAAAPPNLKQEPAPLTAPKPIVPVPVPPIVPVAPVAGVGASNNAGAAAVPGPGMGAGGEGTGRGGGGDGDGGDDGYTPPRQIRGRLRNSDFVRSDEEAGISRRVGVRYLVEEDGHVSECEVTRKSGNAALDTNTCRLIMERFRFRPSRDPQGRPVASYVVENHGWYVEQTPEDR